MKTIMITCCLGLMLVQAYAQQTAGRVVYERTFQLKPRISDPKMDVMPPMPIVKKDKLEVLFNSSQSLRRTVDDDLPEAMESSGNVRLSVTIAGSNDITYTDFATMQTVEQKELGTRNCVVTDSIRPLDWKLTGLTSTVLNYPCQQATAQRVGKRMISSMENGEFKTQEVPDTVYFTAWFTPSVPVPAGPELQGQLPGLILELVTTDGRINYKAVELSPKVDVSAIKAPSKGKTMTAAAFAEERKKMMSSMQRNSNGGRGTTIRIGG